MYIILERHDGKDSAVVGERKGRKEEKEKGKKGRERGNKLVS